MIGFLYDICSFIGWVSFYFIGLPNEELLPEEYSISSSNSELSFLHIIPTTGRISGVRVLNLNVFFGPFLNSIFPELFPKLSSFLALG